MKVIQIVRKNKLLAVVILTYSILGIVMPEKAIVSLKNSWYYIQEMLEIMPVIFVLTSVIEVWVPKELIMKKFGDNSGIKGIVFSFLIGSVSAGPIYAAFPICKLLLKKGASIANVVIILSSWAVIKIPMLANETKFLGPQFMGLRWILTVGSIILMSIVMKKFINISSIPLEFHKEKTSYREIAIKEPYCVGCGLCEKLAPDHFTIVDKKAKWNAYIIEKNQISHLKKIMEQCPSQAISFK